MSKSEVQSELFFLSDIMLKQIALIQCIIGHHHHVLLYIYTHGPSYVVGSIHN